MDDKKQMTDAELQKLLQQIDPPAPDEAEKIATLNMAESRFDEKMKKNAQSRQGNRAGFRPMGVLHDTFIFLTGGKNMKKSYIITGSLALALLGVTTVTMVDYKKLSQDDTMELSVVPSAPSATPPTQAFALPPVPVREDTIAAAPPPPPAMEVQAIPPALPAPTIYEDVVLPAPENKPAKKAERQATAVLAPPPPPAPPRIPASNRAAAGYAAGGMATADMVGSAPTMQRIAPPSPDMPQAAPEYFGRDKFEEIKENPVKVTMEEPVSTFSIDVDTTSYAVTRRALNNGHLPQKDAVRIEELINYFDYNYPVPESRDEPFKPTVALYETPWNADTMLMHVGIKGHELPADAEKPRSNLVFLLDVSGSMNSQDKLPLLKQAFRMLVDTLNEDDTIAIVTYAGRAGVVLEPTKVSEKQEILNAIDMLNSGGSTAGAEGIRTAYELAEREFNKNGVNRVILATDGDFNVGITDRDQLKDFVERKRDTGVYLSVLGFGQGNYNDAMMQTLAQNGNGNAAYIDSINEARKVLVDEATSTLYPIANDVKIQVEFNPAAVSEYRLIGYETRLLKREDFNNDKVDAGDIGAGHTVTALYELTPVGSKAKLVDDLRYADAHEQAAEAPKGDSSEYGFLKLRYKLPGEKTSKLITRAITKDDIHTLDGLSDDVRFAGAVAAFGQVIRGESYVGDFSYDDVLELATPARGADTFNYRGEFLNLVRNAKVADDQQRQPQGGNYYHR